MAEIVNLRQFRKAKEKAEKSAKAAENRTTFGQSKSGKTLTEKRKSIEAARLDGHRLTDEET